MSCGVFLTIFYKRNDCIRYYIWQNCRVNMILSESLLCIRIQAVSMWTSLFLICGIYAEDNTLWETLNLWWYFELTGCWRDDSRAAKCSPLLLDLNQISTCWRFQWFVFSALHLQDLRILWSATFVSYMLLPAVLTRLPYQRCDARSSQHHYSGACRLQLWDMVKICDCADNIEFVLVLYIIDDSWDFDCFGNKTTWRGGVATLPFMFFFDSDCNFFHPLSKLCRYR